MKKLLITLGIVLFCVIPFYNNGNTRTEIPLKYQSALIKYQSALKLSVQELWVILKIKAKADLWNAVIISDDGDHTYLGEISSQFKSKSIFNEFGRYGSEFRSNSIWNEFGRYGSEFRQHSAFNDSTSSPPMIVKNNKIIGRLTTNDSLADAINPNLLKALFEDEL